jgi:hypothetical protein
MSKGLVDQRILVGEASMGGANIVEGLHEEIPYDVLYGSENDTDADVNVEIFDLGFSEDRRDSADFATRSNTDSTTELALAENVAREDYKTKMYSIEAEARDIVDYDDGENSKLFHPLRTKFPTYVKRTKEHIDFKF